MARAFLIVLDSVGVGAAPDAAAYGDEGANTLGHVAQACAEGRAEEGRAGPLRLPNLGALGLWSALDAAGGGGPAPIPAEGRWGAAVERSQGKDTPSGHWELAGVPVPWDWHYFPNTTPAFPEALTKTVAEAAGTDAILGNAHASGTEIIARLGQEHIKTGYPICYTSADSVFQIAAHEDHFGLDRLLAICEAMAPLLHDMRVGRVIARPFVGEPGAFERTTNRKDYAVEPPSPTLLDWVKEAGGATHSIGKISDIFSGRGIDTVDKGPDAKLFENLVKRAETAEDGALVFANFVEFDSLYGHRRDVSGYARHLEWFDAQLQRFYAACRADDLIVITADHGNDPTWQGTEHTREKVPVLMRGRGAGPLGNMTMADVAASIADHLGLDTRGAGESKS